MSVSKRHQVVPRYHWSILDDVIDVLGDVTAALADVTAGAQGAPSEGGLAQDGPTGGHPPSDTHG